MAPFVKQGPPGFQFDIQNPGFVGPNGVAVSPDGKSVYLASWGVARLNRNTTTGALTQPGGSAGCMLNGASVDPNNPIDCGNAHGMVAPKSLVVSADGKNVYVAAPGGDAIARLNRNTTTGLLTQPAGIGGCVSQGGFDTCRNGHALDRPASVAVSPDGKNVYLAAFASDAIARFNRAP
jgi:DNA-binding beta-propeller fold protein YncE